MRNKLCPALCILLLCAGVFAAPPSDSRKMPSGKTLWTHSGTVELNTGEKQIWQKLPKKEITFTLPEISKGKTPEKNIVTIPTNIVAFLGTLLFGVNSWNCSGKSPSQLTL